MNSMPRLSILIRRLYFLRYLFLIRRLRSAAGALFFLVTCQVQSEFHLVAAFIHAAPWHKISVARLSPLLRRRKGASIMLHVISLKRSRHQMSSRFLSMVYEPTLKKWEPDMKSRRKYS